MALQLPERCDQRPEVEILLRCARRVLEPGASDGIDALIAAGIDWRALFVLAEMHCLMPLLHFHLGTCAAAIPRSARVELWARHEATARVNRAMTAELARILAALDSRGITAIPYKGPALAFALFGDIAMREYCDLDILVRPGDMPGAKSALASLGYAADYALAPDVEEAFLRASSQYHLGMTSPLQIPVELHWKSDADFPVERDDDAWWRGLATAALEGESVRTFSASELLLVLCLHGSKHGWQRLAWLADVAELVRAGCGIDWDELVARATAMGAMRRLALGLYLSRELLGAPLPDAIDRQLALDPRVAAIAAGIRAGLFDEGNVFREGPRALRFNLALYERLGDRLRHVRNTLVAPSLVEWTRWPLPRAWHFLYPALRLSRLAVKYLRAPAAQGSAAPAKPS